MEVLFVAAENGAIKGGKVGGIGDVIRDLPPALAAHGFRVTVVIPSHGYLHLGLDSTRIGACRFLFRGELQTADIFEVFPPNGSPGVTQLVIHHPTLSAVDASSGTYHIYTQDPPDRPFFTDGSRFAFFSAAVVAAVSRKVIGSSTSFTCTTDTRLSWPCWDSFTRISRQFGTAAACLASTTWHSKACGRCGAVHRPWKPGFLDCTTIRPRWLTPVGPIAST